MKSYNGEQPDKREGNRGAISFSACKLRYITWCFVLEVCQ